MAGKMEVAKETIPVMAVEKLVTTNKIVLRNVLDLVVQLIGEILRRRNQEIHTAIISSTALWTKERKGNFVCPISVSL